MLRMLPRLARIAPLAKPFRNPFARFASRSWSLTREPKFNTTSKLEPLLLKPSQDSREHYLCGIDYFHANEHQSHQFGYNHWILAFGPAATPALTDLENILELSRRLHLTLNESHFELMIINAKKLRNIADTFQILANKKFNTDINQALFDALLKNPTILDSAKEAHAWLIKKGVNTEENYSILAEEIAKGRINCLLEAKFNSECIDRMKSDEPPKTTSVSDLLAQFKIELSQDQLTQLGKLSETCSQNFTDLLKAVTATSQHQILQLRLIVNTLIANPNYLGEICKAFLTKRSVDQDFLLNPEWINSRLYDLKLMDEIRLHPTKRFGLFSASTQVTTDSIVVEQERSISRNLETIY